MCSNCHSPDYPIEDSVHRHPNTKKYLSILATEVASAHMFSTAGQVLTKLRSQLDPQTVDAILCLHKNYKPKMGELVMLSPVVEGISLPKDKKMEQETPVAPFTNMV